MSYVNSHEAPEHEPLRAGCLHLCEQGRYDLILNDLRMPKMDGAVFYQALQAKYGPAVPRMIFVTGQAHSLDYAGFLGGPASSFSPSPCRGRSAEGSRPSPGPGWLGTS